MKSNKIYDMNKLESSGKFNIDAIRRLFYKEEDFFHALTDFVDNYQRCLSNYTPAFVVNSEAERQSFLAECFNVRAVLMRIGATELSKFLSVMEDALIFSDTKELSDGQMNFKANIEIYTRIIKDAEIKNRPAKKMDEKRIPKAADKKSDKKTKSKEKRMIMVVDDSAVDLQHIASALQTQYEVIACINAQTAIANLKARTPDLFLLSCSMSGINGYELAFLLSSAFNLPQRPIWFLSATKGFDQVRAFMPQNTAVYIEKPVDEHQLLEILDQRLINI